MITSTILESLLRTLKDQSRMLQLQIATVEAELAKTLAAEQGPPPAALAPVPAPVATTGVGLAPIDYDKLASTGGRRRQHFQCQVPGCSGEHVARGLCNAHYSRWHKENRVKPRSI